MRSLRGNLGGGTEFIRRGLRRPHLRRLRQRPRLPSRRLRRRRLPNSDRRTAAGSQTSFVGVRALRSKVKRNKRAFITAFVSPCAGRRGEPVSLWQGRRKLGSRRLDRVCTVRFRPRVKHRVAFRAKVLSDGTYTEATSRRLTIRILRRKRRH